jgi:hypothetical protein
MAEPPTVDITDRGTGVYELHFNITQARAGPIDTLTNL